MDFLIEHNKIAEYFFTNIDDKQAKMDYRVYSNGKILDYYSTFVPPELRGQHIASRIVKCALEYAKENNYKVIPSCPFVENFINTHLEYKNLRA